MQKKIVLFLSILLTFMMFMFGIVHAGVSGGFDTIDIEVGNISSGNSSDYEDDKRWYINGTGTRYVLRLDGEAFISVTMLHLMEK